MTGHALPVLDAAPLRAAAARLQLAGTRAEQAARRLRGVAAQLAPLWRGAAASAALQDLQRLVDDLLLLAGTHADAAAVVAACARALDEAQATWQRAAAVDGQDLEERQRAAARGAFVSPYDSPARRHARALRSQAHAQADSACGRAAAQLRDLAAQARRDDAALSTAEQLAGVGRGAADAVRGSADLVIDLLRDPRSTAGGVVEGWTRAARDPREAAVAASGWELLQQGRYGEWAGGFAPDLLAGVLSGGAVPAGRRSADLGRRLSEPEQLHRRPFRGGDVDPRPGAVMSPRYPRRIRPFSPERQRHVLVGDPPPRTGGGHRFGAGRGKSEFPRGWTDDLIVRRVMDTAARPLSTKDQPDRETLLAYAEHDGVCVQVVVDPRGKVVTGYPVTGPVAAQGCGSERRTA